MLIKPSPQIFFNVLAFHIAKVAKQDDNEFPARFLEFKNSQILEFLPLVFDSLSEQV